MSKIDQVKIERVKAELRNLVPDLHQLLKTQCTYNIIIDKFINLLYRSFDARDKILVSRMNDRIKILESGNFKYSNIFVLTKSSSEYFKFRNFEEIHIISRIFRKLMKGGNELLWRFLNITQNFFGEMLISGLGGYKHAKIIYVKYPGDVRINIKDKNITKKNFYGITFCCRCDEKFNKLTEDHIKVDIFPRLISFTVNISNIEEYFIIYRKINEKCIPYRRVEIAIR